jgi:hypothetical protein
MPNDGYDGISFGLELGAYIAENIVKCVSAELTKMQEILILWWWAHQDSNLGPAD